MALTGVLYCCIALGMPGQVRHSKTARGLMQAVEVWVYYSMPARRVLRQHKQHSSMLHWARRPSLEPQLVALCHGLFSHVHRSCKKLPADSLA